MSESKFRDDPAAFIPHILNRDRDALGALITKPEVERKLLVRVRNKAKLTASQLVDPRNTGLRDLIREHEYTELNAGDCIDAAKRDKEMKCRTNSREKHAHPPSYPSQQQRTHLACLGKDPCSLSMCHPKRQFSPKS